jgi:uncharacterized protein YqgV (UPF0045/DUF77 family)
MTRIFAAANGQCNAREKQGVDRDQLSKVPRPARDASATGSGEAYDRKRIDRPRRTDMLVAFSLWPSGGPGGDSGHDAIAAAVQVVRESGLPNRTDAMFTTLEGEWDEVFDVIHRASDAALAFGTRVDLVLKADIRPGHTHEIEGKVARLEKALAARKAAGR